MSDEEENPTPPPPLLPPPSDLPPPPPLPAAEGLPVPPPLPPMGDLPPPLPMPEVAIPPPIPEMMAPPPMPEMPAPPPMPEMPAPPPMPEMPAPPPMPEMPSPPPMPEMMVPPPMPEMSAPPPMPDIAAPLTASSESVEEHVELPDPISALDLLSTVPSTSEPISSEPSSTPDLLLALDSPTDDVESIDSELSVADYKWKDSVLEAIIEKYDITDRDAFLVHARAFDANKNMYLTKKELTQAAKEWVELTTPIAELDTVPDSLEGAMPEAADPEPASESVVQESTDPPPDLSPPPIADPPLELPPLPEELPPLPSPPVMELPPLPAPSPESTVEIQESMNIESPVDDPSMEDTEDYRELWKRRSDKSLPQMYGAIDRIGSGEIGSLLDRYSDRFGHELDREIIVMRRAEQDARREAVPVVELISSPDEPEDDEEDELKIQLNEVEAILRPLQNAYKAAEDKAEKKRLAPALKALIAERKILLSVISGESDQDALDDIPDRPDVPHYGGDTDDDVEVSTGDFADFFNIINQLLGDMPEDWVNDFVQSKGFALFQEVGADPDGANEKTRKKFFNMINNELGSMPDDMLDAFVASPEFDLYKTIGEMYGA